jgi:hypothetical protein
MPGLPGCAAAATLTNRCCFPSIYHHCCYVQALRPAVGRNYTLTTSTQVAGVCMILDSATAAACKCAPHLELFLQVVQQLICYVVVLILRHLSMPACEKYSTKCSVDTGMVGEGMSCRQLTELHY